MPGHKVRVNENIIIVGVQFLNLQIIRKISAISNLRRIDDLVNILYLH